MRRRTFLEASGRVVLVSSFVPLGAWSQTRRQPDEARGRTRGRALVADLERLIPTLMSKTIVPGLSIALIQDGKLLWRRGFGVRDSASKTPVDDNTVFEAASVSKTVFAYAVMKLCEKGVLDLDTPLTKYGPKAFLQGDPRIELITARHVLSHTSGFQDWRSKAEPLKIHFTPGEKFLYSGEGYYYLQSVVTRLTGHMDCEKRARYEADLEVCATDIDDYMKRNLLAPFGMTSGGYVWNDTFEKHDARPHDAQGKPFDKKKPTATDAARYASAGGLHTTPTDYARFLMEILDPKESDAFRLTKRSLKEMLRPQVRLGEQQKIDGASSWALGWAVQERKTGDIIVHSGGQDGFKSLTMASVDRKSGFVVLTNGDDGWKIFHNETFRQKMDELLAA